MSFSNTRTQLLAPLEILMSKISLKYIPINIHNFEHSRVIMNMKLSSHGFLFHININMRENKAQIPLIIHHNEKKQRIYFSCAAKDNWASQISEVALTKELEQWKEEDVCLYRPNARRGGEFEWLKTLQRPQLENCRTYLSLGISKP